MGGEDRDIHFNSMTYGQGASSALPVCAYFFQKVYKDKDLGYSPDEKFKIPEGFDPCQDTILTEEAPVEEYGGIDEVFE